MQSAHFMLFNDDVGLG